MNVRVTAEILRANAEGYLNAANLACKPPASKQDMPMYRLRFPVYFLIGRSIELALKAFLLARGETVKKLKHNYRHDLSKPLKASRKRKLGREVKLKPKQIKAVLSINHYYTSKLLEYIEVGAYFFPPYKVLHETAESLVTGLKPYCLKNTLIRRKKTTKKVVKGIYNRSSISLH